MAEPSQPSQDPVAGDQEIDQDPDIGMVGTEEIDQQPPPRQQVAPEAELPMPMPPPSRKDATLREFLGKMDDYAPIIPDAVTAHYLTLAGLPPPPQPGQPSNSNSTPPQLARLLALATQKFIADVAADAYQYSRIRAGNTSSTTTTNPLGIPGAGPPGGAPGAAGAAGGDKSKAGGREAHLGSARPGYGGGGQGGQQGRTVLTMEDLGMAVGEYGINIKRSEFYR